ncbi:MAG: GAF domain-containing protein [Magnetovibrionaceae bacterium]
MSDIDQIGIAAEKESKGKENNARLAKIIANIVMPLALSLWVGFNSRIIQLSNEYFFWGILSAAAVAQLGLFVWLFQHTPSSTWIYFLSQRIDRQRIEANRKAEKLQKLVNRQSLEMEISLAWTGAIRSLYPKHADQHSLDDQIQVLVGQLISQSSRLFGLRSDEAWSFEVYLRDKDGRCLTSIWRLTHPSHPSHGNRGRSWEIGRGIVGQTYVDKEFRIITDSYDSTQKKLLGVSDSDLQDHDKEYYRSAAAFPIKFSDGHILGVFIATSNEAERFTAENTSIFEYLCNHLGNAILISEEHQATFS